MNRSAEEQPVEHYLAVLVEMTILVSELLSKDRKSLTFCVHFGGSFCWVILGKFRGSFSFIQQLHELVGPDLPLRLSCHLRNIVLSI